MHDDQGGIDPWTIGYSFEGESAISRHTLALSYGIPASQQYATALACHLFLEYLQGSRLDEAYTTLLGLYEHEMLVGNNFYVAQPQKLLPAKKTATKKTLPPSFDEEG